MVDFEASAETNDAEAPDGELPDEARCATSGFERIQCGTVRQGKRELDVGRRRELRGASGSFDRVLNGGELRLQVDAGRGLDDAPRCLPR